MISAQKHNVFLNLICLGIGHSAPSLPEQIDWRAVKALANAHGLLAVMIDGMERLPEQQRPPKTLLLEWIGNTLQSYEQRYTLYENAIGKLASFYNQHGYKMMVLKGYACSLDWPKPEHRPCGDIDIWLFGQWQEADKALANTNLTNGTNIKIDSSHHHHTVFDWMGFAVENHYDFINVHHHKSHRALEKILKELGRDDSHYDEVNGEKVFLPCPNLHALFLLKHLMLHFSTGEITLRQLLDWGFFVEKHSEEIDWAWLEGVLDEYGMKDLYNVFNAICVGDLGFDVHIFKQVQFDPSLKERVLKDILSPEFCGDMPKNVFKRVVWKWRRWRANEWKHKLCYKESMWSAFWSGVWGHLMKPKSI